MPSGADDIIATIYDRIKKLAKAAPQRGPELDKAREQAESLIEEYEQALRDRSAVNWNDDRAREHRKRTLDELCAAYGKLETTGEKSVYQAAIDRLKVEHVPYGDNCVLRVEQRGSNWHADVVIDGASEIEFTGSTRGDALKAARNHVDIIVKPAKRKKKPLP